MTVEKKVVSIQEKIKDLAFEEIGDIFNFSSDYYGAYLLRLVDEFLETEQISEKIASALVPHFISWAVFSHRLSHEKKSIFELYLDTPRYKSRIKPKVHTLISEWTYAVPGVYYIEGILGERVLVLNDIILMKERLVGVYNEIYHQPKESDLLIGYLLPAGDGTYSPIIDFFHIPAVRKKQAANRIIDFYNKAKPQIMNSSSATTQNYSQLFQMYLNKEMILTMKIDSKDQNTKVKDVYISTVLNFIHMTSPRTLQGYPQLPSY